MLSVADRLRTTLSRPSPLYSSIAHFRTMSACFDVLGSLGKAKLYTVVSRQATSPLLGAQRVTYLMR